MSTIPTRMEAAATLAWPVDSEPLSAWRQWLPSMPRCQSPTCPDRNQRWRWLLPRVGRMSFQGGWCCSAECYRDVLNQAFRRELAGMNAAARKSHRLPLGLLLLSQGQITADQLRRALKAQRLAGEGRIGEWLQRLGVLSEPQLTTALGLQWSCPVLSLPRYAGWRKWAEKVPLELLQAYKMLPVHFVESRRTLYVAFMAGVDAGALYAIEQILDCHTEPCVAQQSALAQALEQLQEGEARQSVRFDEVRDPHEMARITRNYTRQLDASDARLASCGHYIWVQLSNRRQCNSLLFRIVSEAEEQDPAELRLQMAAASAM